jgi:adenylate cyclase
LRDLRKLERERASLGQFFSPVVLASLSTDDPDVLLQPSEAELSVLFCDLRGFSRATERAADQLLVMLERVSLALGIATRHICDAGGVLGDFHGDAVMGFWGWPIEMEDAPRRAAMAAIAIRDAFADASRAGDTLADFRVGIGIATGKAVAGKIGTVDQVKVTAFGPAVNLSSRLEEMTKTLHAPILIDERTAELLRGSLAGDVGRLRRVARVRPFGLDRDMEVTELLPPDTGLPTLTAEGVRHYERALDEFCAGRWQAAFESLHLVPAEDRVKDFLTMYIVQHNRTAPEGWRGVIQLSGK